MAVVTEKYNIGKITKLEQILQADAENGEPRDYEIWVDDLKVVQRTSDPERFTSYEDYIETDTRSISIKIYEKNSRRNIKYIFTYNTEGFQGLGGIEAINEKIAQERKSWESDLKDKEIESLKEDLKESEKYATKLEGTIQQMSTSKDSSEINWNSLLAVALEGLLKNPTVLSKMGLDGGTANKENVPAEKALPENKPQSSEPIQKQNEDIKIKEESTSPPEGLSEEEKGFINIIKVLRSQFNEQQVCQLAEVLGYLCEDKAPLKNIWEIMTSRHVRRENSKKAASAAAVKKAEDKDTEVKQPNSIEENSK